VPTWHTIHLDARASVQHTQQDILGKKHTDAIAESVASAVVEGKGAVDVQHALRL
jgi:hypothetical protein